RLAAVTASWQAQPGIGMGAAERGRAVAVIAGLECSVIAVNWHSGAWRVRGSAKQCVKR
ncbi:hypothetical protein IWW49_005924, partial [Coemansia sp. RSA 1797]